MTERDPNGADQHAPGAKLDAGKLEVETVLGGFAHALEAVSAVGTFGALKYTRGGWKEVPDAAYRYANAAGRHRLARQTGELFDPQTGVMHLAHEAWNILAQLEFAIASHDEGYGELRLPAEENTPSSLPDLPRRDLKIQCQAMKERQRNETQGGALNKGISHGC